VAADADVFVGLMVHRVEDKGNNARTVDVNRHRRGSRFQLLEQVHHPLRFFGCEVKSCILRVIGAGGNERVQLSVPGKNSVIIEEHVRDGTTRFVSSTAKKG